MKNSPDSAYLSVFCMEMAEILRSGILAGEGFLLISEQEPDPGLKKAYADVYGETVSGGTVADAMAKTALFPEYMLRMIRVGEETGSLEKVFRSLSAYYERQDKLRRTIRSTVAYPLLLFVIVLAVFFVFLTEVLPIFNNVFSQIGATMSPLALAFLNAGTWLAGPGMWVLVLIGAVIAAALVIFCVPSLQDKLGSRFGGKLGEMISTARLASVLSLCMTGAADINETLHMACDFAADFDRAEKIEKCAKLVSGGRNFSAAADETGLFAPVYCRMLSIAEHTGSSDTVMADVARRTEEDMERAVDRFTGRIEPAAVIILSVVVGLLLLAVMMPLVGIMSAL